tara:strand:- start:9585 stop:10256 length:672 start_codon:yes stop_codon:yes gene_type:complete
MPALSDKSILQEKEEGNIIIDPFDRKNLNTSSYDVTLGEYYFREGEPERFLGFYNPWCEADVRAVWGEPLQAQPAFKLLDEAHLGETGIAPRDKVIIIKPGETILAHTEEFIGGRNHITTMMKARSSLGRNFIEVCKCAGWGDVGFFNRWTMEITNNSRHRAIPLIVGRRIAQIVFFETGDVLDVQYSGDGKYQTSTEIEELKRSWNPNAMLPKLFKDREIGR